MTLTQAASALTISAKTLRLAAERGEVEAQHPLADGPWIFKRTPSRANRLAASNAVTAPAIPPRDMTLINKTSIFQ